MGYVASALCRGLPQCRSPEACWNDRTRSSRRAARGEQASELTTKQKPDTQKGSYYVNPLLDHPEVSDEKRAAHPEYVIPCSRGTAKSLTVLIVGVRLTTKILCRERMAAGHRRYGRVRVYVQSVS